MAVAPPAAWGMISTPPPRRNGGNMDNKELVAGTTLYLPIHTDGALFSCGDGHGVQGDGEVCITAIETGLVGTFELIARDDMNLEWPMAETPTHVMTMAFDPDLDDCVVIALRADDRSGLRARRARPLAGLHALAASPPTCASRRSSTAARACTSCWKSATSRAEPATAAGFGSVPRAAPWSVRWRYI